MKFLYPCDPNNSKKVEPDFEDEYKSLSNAVGSHCVTLFDFDRFIAGDLNIIAKIKGHRLLYRGWMMNEKQYNDFTKLINNCGGALITTKNEYLRTHHLPYWYPICKELTATTVVYENKKMQELKDVSSQKFFDKNGRKHWFVKDYVKSNTGIAGSVANNASRLNDIIKEIKLYRGEVEGGICLREFEHYKHDTEVRLFVYRGSVYCDDSIYGKLPEFVDEIVKNIESPFYTIDLIRKKGNNHWRLVELGDGQVSSLKNLPMDIFQCLVDDIYDRETAIEREIQLLESSAVMFVNHDWLDSDASIKLHDECPELYETHYLAIGKEPDEAYLHDLSHSSNKSYSVDSNVEKIKSKVKEFENLMNPILDVIYENEQKFINHFLSEHRGYELTGVDFSPENVRFNVLCHSGMHAVCTEPLERVLNWYERVIS